MTKRDEAYELVRQLDMLLHDMCNEGSAEDRRHAEWAHGLVHDAAAHLSGEAEIRAQVALQRAAEMHHHG